MAGAPLGNDNARQGRRWREALNRALARAGTTVDAGLDKCADKLVESALSGAPWALEHVAERMDGKATQVIHAQIETESRLTYAERLAAETVTTSGPAAETVGNTVQ